ncbi:uncharacterized protein E0L32_002173 [Thyridium curvatum]|uniref:FAD synthase n=1 Tax=Thyridium curvatum TaxID=1093900 RepID=A0A507ATN7_9PEZI|nr:uncharacterized protein E0L32_001960 [Thyridium curvatum]XP_030989281.1 uncharacterized protein E0L32_002173 [Thyridium curvatum]TPX07357.1 hypothetical protein E0L32_001960 [Thyridium curvatum]TPX07570.1 hypothetical protein E0L32_002173 [Thyridium curvatum]
MSAFPTPHSSSQGPSITRAKTEDVPAIKELITAAYTKYVERMNQLPGPMLADYVKLIEEGKQDVFVLTREETVVAAEGEGADTKSSRIVGSVVLSNLPDEDAIEVNKLVVDPKVQRSGYGRILMDYSEEVAKARGFKAVVLFTNVKMYENIAYYSKLGSRRTLGDMIEEQDRQTGPAPPRLNGGGSIPDAAAAAASRSLEHVCLELRDKVDAFLNQKASTPLLSQVQDQLRISIGVVEDALNRYECVNGRVRIPSPRTAVLTPMQAGTARDKLQRRQRLAVYVVADHSFPQVDEFTESTARQYRLDLCRFALPMRQALDAYLAERPSVRAIFVGTRRTDPHGANLKHFDPTSAGWPDFMRVHPVIDWHYAEIWAGYTSLGGTTDTHPNPQLAKAGAGGKFRPAYELVADDEERLGRDA